MNNKNKCDGSVDTPCTAALDMLPKQSIYLKSWRGIVHCPYCQRAWRGDYYALNRWPGDRGSAFGWKLLS